MLKLMLDLCADVNIADRNDGSLLRHDWPMQIARIVVPEPNFKIFFTKRLTIVSSSAVGVECYCVQLNGTTFFNFDFDAYTSSLNSLFVQN